MPPGAIRDQIVATTGMCETVSHGIEILQGSLKRLDSILYMIDDASTREPLQYQIRQMQASLSADSEKLSDIKHNVLSAATCKHQPVF
jgi:hypothetical protein